jgi:hypothetical protein
MNTLTGSLVGKKATKDLRVRKVGRADRAVKVHKVLKEIRGIRAGKGRMGRKAHREIKETKVTKETKATSGLRVQAVRELVSRPTGSATEEAILQPRLARGTILLLWIPIRTRLQDCPEISLRTAGLLDRG